MAVQCGAVQCITMQFPVCLGFFALRLVNIASPPLLHVSITCLTAAAPPPVPFKAVRNHAQQPCTSALLSHSAPALAPLQGVVLCRQALLHAVPEQADHWLDSQPTGHTVAGPGTPGYHDCASAGASVHMGVWTWREGCKGAHDSVGSVAFPAWSEERRHFSKKGTEMPPISMKFMALCLRTHRLLTVCALVFHPSIQKAAGGCGCLNQDACVHAVHS
eukprot:600137-Pelagomonas_calceolata.AAC.4